jgi:hypothetical protein
VGDVKTLHDVRSDNDWDDFLLMDSNPCLKFMKGENGGCISFGNQELMENIQCTTMQDFDLYI